MEGFINSLEKLSKCLLSEKQKKKPKQKDIENMLEMLTEGYKNEQGSKKTTQIEAKIFNILMAFLFHFEDNPETLFKKVYEMIKILKRENCPKETVKFFLGKCTENLKINFKKKSKFTLIASIDIINKFLTITDEGLFKEVLPGMTTIIFDYFSLQFPCKEKILEEICKTLEIFMRKLTRFYFKEIKAWLELNKKRNFLREVGSLFSRNLEIYKKFKSSVSKDYLDNKSEKLNDKNLEKLFEKIIHSLNFLKNSIAKLTKFGVKILKAYMKTLSYVYELIDVEGKNGGIVGEQISLISLKIYANLLEMGEEEKLKINTFLVIDEKILQNELQKSKKIFGNFSKILTSDEKMTSLNYSQFLVSKMEYMNDIGLNEIFKFWGFKLSNILIESFTLKNQDLVIDYKDFTENFSKEKFSKNNFKLENLIFRSLIDFLPSTNYKKEIFDKMKFFTMKILEKSRNLKNEILSFGNDLVEFLQEIYYNLWTCEIKSIEEFRNYKKIDKFLDDFICWLFLIHTYSHFVKTSEKLKIEFLQEIYSIIKKIEIFDSVLKSFFLDDRETVKFRVIKSLKKMMFFDILKNLFSALTTGEIDDDDDDDDDSFDFGSITAYYDFVYLVMSNDNEDDKISHFSFYVCLSDFLKNYFDYCERSGIELGNSPSLAFENLAPYLFEKIQILDLNCTNIDERLRNVAVLNSLVNLLSSSNQKKNFNFEISKKSINFTNSLLDKSEILTNSMILKITKIFKSSLKILITNQEDFTKEAKNSLENPIYDFNKNLPLANTIRVVHLKLSDLIESSSSYNINIYLEMLTSTIEVLKDVPMKPETEKGRFSSEDGANVEIPSTMEPMIHELWPRFQAKIKSVCTRVLFRDEFGEILIEYVKMMSKRREEAIDVDLKKLVEISYGNLNVEEFKEKFQGVRKLVLKSFKNKGKFYAEFVGVNLMKFLEKVDHVSSKFLSRGGRFEDDLLPYFKVFVLGSDFKTLNSLIKGFLMLKLSKSLGHSEGFGWLKNVIVSKEHEGVKESDLLKKWFLKIKELTI